MKLAPQSHRTFFITAVTCNRRRLFQVDRHAELLLQILRELPAENKFQLHAFVIMPDHFHLLLTPAYEVSVEKAVQFVKGRFSYRAKKDLGLASDLWQAGFTQHRIRDADDYSHHQQYILNNPIRAGLGTRISVSFHPISRPFRAGATVAEAQNLLCRRFTGLKPGASTKLRWACKRWKYRPLGR